MPDRSKLCEKGTILAKSGIRNRGVILQPRDRLLLSALKRRRYVEREQASVICGFRSASRAKARLLALTRAGVLSRLFVGTISGGRRAVYFLPSMRRQSSPRKLASRKTELFVEHQLAVNAVVLGAQQHDDRLQVIDCEWSTKPAARVSKVRPDAVLEIRLAAQVRGLLIEVDLDTEPLRTIREKVLRYLSLARSGQSEQLLGVPQFRVLFVVRGSERLTAIREVVACETDQLFWFAESEIVTREGFWARVWLRPTGVEKHSLS